MRFQICDGFFIVEKSGECIRRKDNDSRFQKENCKKYAAASSPGKAWTEMEKERVPVNHRPGPKYMENYRASVKAANAKAEESYAGDSIISLKTFLADPPDGVRVLSQEITDKRTRVYFTVEGAAREASALAAQGDVWLCTDATFQTNDKNLVLGVVGPAGNFYAGRRYPGMRCIPLLAWIADREDTEAHSESFKRALALADEYHGQTPTLPRVKGVFVDGMSGTPAAIADAFGGANKVSLIRDLQHVKNNIRDESVAVDPDSSPPGARRLCNLQLRPHLQMIVEFAAKLPNVVQFSALMRNTLERLQDPRDWDEPAMHRYMRDHTLDCTQAFITAEWRAGLDVLPPGLTSYLSNAKEARWRWHKAYYGPHYKRQAPATMIKAYSNVVAAWHTRGDFARVRRPSVHDAPLPGVLDARSRAKGGRVVVDIEAEPAGLGKQSDRLVANKIYEWYLEKGAAGTFRRDACNVHFVVDGHQFLAVELFVMAKYKLKKITDHPEDVDCVRKLSLAQTEADVYIACSCMPDKVVYDVSRHRELMEQYTYIYVTADCLCFDAHPDFLKAGHQSEHSVFVRGIVAPEEIPLGGVARGPAARSGRKAARGRKLQKRSAALKAMIRPKGYKPGVRRGARRARAGAAPAAAAAAAGAAPPKRRVGSKRPAASAPPAGDAELAAPPPAPFLRANAHRHHRQQRRSFEHPAKVAAAGVEAPAQAAAAGVEQPARAAHAAAASGIFQRLAAHGGDLVLDVD